MASNGESSKYSRPIELLWIALALPGCKDAAAGHAVFRYYFRAFYDDSRFNIRTISYESSKYYERSVSMYPDAIQHSIDGEGTPNFKKLVNAESRLNPLSKHGGMIGNWEAARVIQKAVQWSNDGYSPDIIILDWTQSVLLAPEIHGIFPTAKLVAVEHDVSFVGYERHMERAKGFVRRWWRLRFRKEKEAEINALKLCDAILPLNKDNIDLLIQEGIPEKHIHWLVPYYEDMSAINRHPIGKNMLFFGAMNRPENYLSVIWFAEHVMPLLDDQELRLVVLGGNPDKSLFDIEDSRVEMVGFVEDVRPYFEICFCMVVPLVYGAGIKIKVLEAMSAGMPVVSNSIGIEGYDVKDGVEYLHGETPEEFAFAIESLLASGHKAEAIGAAARDYVLQSFSFRDCSQSYRDFMVALSAGFSE